jgi:NAD+ synthase/NAD+ synthase (glutamine-hydrolysing)
VLRGKNVALTICEDAWNDRQFWKQRLYQRDPVEELFEAGGELLLCINASPYHMGKREFRRNVYRAAARRYRKPVVYVNQVGGNDQLVFDGSSFAMNAEGEVVASARSFEEDLVLFDSDAGPATATAIFRMSAKPLIRRWCWARAITSASADSREC